MAAATAHLLHGEEQERLQASELDDLTHAEMCLLYRESTEAISFAKNKQWQTLGATLVLFASVLVLDRVYPGSKGFGQLLLVMSMLVSGGAIYSLAIFQVWQKTERDKLRAVTRKFSSLTQKIRSIKSRREANVFRYLLLSFLIFGVLMGEVIVLMVLTGSAR